MNRTVLIIVAVLLLLFGIGRVGTGLMMVSTVHASGVALGFYLVYYLGVGVAAIVAGVLLLRGQRAGSTGDAAQDAAAERDTRRALKVVVIVIALLAGLAGLLLSLCGGLVMQGHLGDGGGLILGIGIALVVAAIVALVWASRR